MTEQTKRCSRCGEVKPLAEFYKEKVRNDGYGSYCKKCRREYARDRYQGNKDRILSQMQRCRQQNMEKYAEYQRKYRKCVTNPSCPAVGGCGAEFMLFTCEVCGKEFRRIKSEVDWNYEHYGKLPRFCSNDCKYFARRKDYKSPYYRRVEEAKHRLHSGICE